MQIEELYKQLCEDQVVFNDYDEWIDHIVENQHQLLSDLAQEIRQGFIQDFNIDYQVKTISIALQLCSLRPLVFYAKLGMTSESIIEAALSLVDTLSLAHSSSWIVLGFIEELLRFCPVCTLTDEDELAEIRLLARTWIRLDYEDLQDKEILELRHRVSRCMILLGQQRPKLSRFLVELLKSSYADKMQFSVGSELIEVFNHADDDLEVPCLYFFGNMFSERNYEAQDMMETNDVLVLFDILLSRMMDVSADDPVLVDYVNTLGKLLNWKFYLQRRGELNDEVSDMLKSLKDREDTVEELGLCIDSVLYKLEHLPSPEDFDFLQIILKQITETDCKDPALLDSLSLLKHLVGWNRFPKYDFYWSFRIRDCMSSVLSNVNLDNDDVIFLAISIQQQL